MIESYHIQLITIDICVLDLQVFELKIGARPFDHTYLPIEKNVNAIHVINAEFDYITNCEGSPKIT